MSLKDNSSRSKEQILSEVSTLTTSALSGLKFPAKFKCPDFKKYHGKSYPFAHLKVYGVAIAKYGDNGKLLRKPPRGA